MAHQFSLFDLLWPTAELAPSAPVAAPPGIAQQAPEAPDLPPQPVPMGTSLAPHAPGTVDHGHPQADRDILLNQTRVAYLLKRAKRKTVGFQVSAEGLTVLAPRWVGQAEIDQMLRSKASWILRKLADQQQRARRLDAARIEWRDGGSLPYLGQALTLRLDSRVAGAQRQADVLQLGLPAHADAQQIRDLVQSWLQREARALFEARCAHFAQVLGVQFKRLMLSAAQTRWGSASASGVIRLNWRLIHFAPAVIDYVVVHELAHLREMNHSPAFWEVVRSVVPDYGAVRQQLSQEVLPPME